MTTEALYCHKYSASQVTTVYMTKWLLLHLLGRLFKRRLAYKRWISRKY